LWVGTIRFGVPDKPDPSDGAGGVLVTGEVVVDGAMVDAVPLDDLPLLPHAVSNNVRQATKANPRHIDVRRR
jgi:hypothetical protein